MAKRRALLIASNFGGLKGTEEDVRMMANALALNGFDDIESCIGEKATRNGILESWRGLIRRTSSADAAVIYYSGHGGLVEPTKATGSDGHLRDRPSRRQFIVPTDYDPKANDFRGILDVELSHILQDTTCQTDNVTLILDCCHSGSMARDPSLGDDAIQRSLDEVQYHSLLEHQDLLLEQGRLPGLDEPHGNSKAVRIVAATTDEKAWEYKNGAVWNGAMTQALSQVLHECRGTEASWRTTMARVRELVGLQTLLQHPHAEGPVSRLHFSLSTAEDTWLPVGVVGGSAFIMAGHLREVYQGNEYSILPAGSAAFDGELEIASATVSLVVGFKAKLVLAPRGVTLPREGAVAFAKKIVLPRRPAAVSSRVPEAARVPLLDGIARSQYLRLPEPESDDHNSCLANLECDGEYLVLYNNYGVAISSQKIPGPGGDVPSAVYGRILRDAEQLARAQHLLTLKNMNILASITTPLSISVGVVEKMKRARQVETDGTGWLYPEERICVSLTNNGNEKCYVHVFNVNVSGEISLVTTLFGMGVPLAPGEEFEVGRNEFDEPVGLEVTWPRGDIPKTEPIVESLVFIQTDGPVDLHHLQGSAGRGTTAASSQLEQLADSIAAGTGRDVGGQKGAKIVRYQVSVKQFTLGLRVPTRGRDLLTPEAAEEDPQQRGILGHLSRAVKKVQPYVWIINKHSEEITVVVSQLSPNRQVSEVGLDANPTGGGFSLAFSYWDSPATKKTLAPEAEDKRSSVGRFPLWTNKHGFGVITIFTGPNMTAFISKDRIEAGVIAFFEGRPNLRIVPYDKTLVLEG